MSGAKPRERILVVDDDASITASLALLLKRRGFEVQEADSPAAALEVLEGTSVQLVLQDMNFSRETTGEEGLRLLETIKSRWRDLPVVLMTAWGSIELAVKGMQIGAADFITKPWTNDQLLRTVETSLDLRSTRKSTTPRSREALDESFDFSGIVGAEPALTRILDLAGRVAATDASVLITGESGTGKELMAEALHRNSRRKNRPFVKVNLGGLSSTLFESEMFGHVRGAFTDARQDRKGRFEVADSGTIFLDEVGELELGSQVKLLRVLQDLRFEVLGSSITRKVDVRIVSATNRDLTRMVAEGTFREDLLYRLNLIALELPPLRERPADIPRLSRHFLEYASRVYGRSGLHLGDGAASWLSEQSWPGNIRQLKQVIERVVLLASGSEESSLERSDFEDLSDLGGEPRPKATRLDAGNRTLEEVERELIEERLLRFGGNISRVAKALGLSRAALYRRCEKFGIEPKNAEDSAPDST